MRARYWTLLVFLCFYQSSRAAHIKGAYISYVITQPKNIYTYTATLVTYTDSRSISADRPMVYIAWGDGDSSLVQRKSQEIMSPANTFTWKNIYVAEHTYKAQGSYKISYREPDTVQLNDSSERIPFYVETALQIDSAMGCNSSPQLEVPPIFSAEAGLPYSQALNTYDIEGDSLSFGLERPLGLQGDSISIYGVPAGATLLEDRLYFNPDPNKTYLFRMKISEWRKGKRIGYVAYQWITAALEDSARKDTLALHASCENDKIACLFNGPPGQNIKFQLTIPKSQAKDTIKMFAPGILAGSRPSFTTHKDSAGNLVGQFSWTPGMQPCAAQLFRFVFRAEAQNKLGNTYATDKEAYILVEGHTPGCAYYLSVPKAEEKDDAMKVYPNPLPEGAVLKIDHWLPNSQFTLFDDQGRKMLSYYPPNGEVILPREKLHTGIYFYRLTTQQGSVSSGKLILE